MSLEQAHARRYAQATVGQLAQRYVDEIKSAPMLSAAELILWSVTLCTAKIAQYRDAIAEMASDTYESESKVAGVEIRLHPYVEAERAERKLLLDTIKAAHAMRIAEREVAIAERQGEMIATTFRAVFGDPELGLTPAQQVAAQRVASKHLRILPAAG